MEILDGATAGLDPADAKFSFKLGAQDGYILADPRFAATQTVIA